MRVVYVLTVLPAVSRSVRRGNTYETPLIVCFASVLADLGRHRGVELAVYDLHGSVYRDHVLVVEHIQGIGIYFP